MSERTTLEIRDGAAWITLDDGKVNAMSTAMMREIGARLDEAGDAVVVLHGRKGIFSAGFDLATFRTGPAEVREMLTTGAELIVRLLEHPRPVLAACTGHAYPAGAFLMMASDVRIGIDGPYRLGMNETAIALTVPLFAIEIARHRLTPAGFAAIQSATMFAPRDAAAAGYLDRVVEPDELDTAVAEEATRLGTLDRTAFTETKARINERAIAAVRAAVQRELAAA